MHGRHLTLFDREVIAQLRAQGCSQAEVARKVGCHPSTIGRELTRNHRADAGYFPSRAKVLAWTSSRDVQPDEPMSGREPAAPPAAQAAGAMDNAILRAIRPKSAYITGRANSSRLNLFSSSICMIKKPHVEG